MRRFAVQLVSLLFFATCVFLPSHKISFSVQRPFAFEVPKSIPAGNIFTFPASNVYQTVHMGLTKPMVLDDKGLYFMAFNGEAPSHEFYILYKITHKTGALHFITRLLFSEPVYFSSGTVVIGPVAETTSNRPIRGRVPASIPPRRISEKAQEANAIREAQDDIRLTALMKRDDGMAQLSCWTPPFLNPAAGTALRAHGPGETVMAEETAAQGKTVVIYHGGGIFTRYMNLREFQTHVGEKVGSGQLIGFAGSPGRRENPKFWEVSWNDKILNPVDFLEFSQKFCGKSKHTTAKNGGAAERSPAMKLFQQMLHHQKKHD